MTEFLPLSDVQFEIQAIYEPDKGNPEVQEIIGAVDSEVALLFLSTTCIH
jgi:hypothetical protein